MNRTDRIMRCAAMAVMITGAAAAYSLTQRQHAGRTGNAATEVYHGHGCCANRATTVCHDSRHMAGCGSHHGVTTAAARAQDCCRGYHCDGTQACFGGRNISGADPKSFTPLGGGYAKDAHSAYYMGRRIDGAKAKSFRYIGRGMAKDAKNTYMDGVRTE